MTKWLASWGERLAREVSGGQVRLACTSEFSNASETPRQQARRLLH